MKTRRILGLISFFSLLMALSLYGEASLAATFPDKPIKLISNFPPGSGIDIEARAIAPYLQKHLGVSVTVENVAGADGKIGLSRLWKTEPNGYTLIMHSTSMSIIVERLSNPEYQITGFTPIFSWSRTNQVLVVNTANWKNLDEFVKGARERTLSVGMSGRGSVSHLMGLMFVDGLGLKVNWVPFDGGGEALTALAGKHVDFVTVAATSALPLVKAGKLRAILTFGDSRDPGFPETPIPKEAGYPMTMISLVRGMDGPPKLPEPIVRVIEEAFEKAIKEPDFLIWAQKRMMEIVPLRHEAYQKVIMDQQKLVEKYIPFLKAGN